MALLQPHRLAAILFWRLLGKRLRARGRLDSALSRLPFAIERKIRRHAEGDLASIALATKVGRTTSFCAHIHIDAGSSIEQARRAITSAIEQSHMPERVFVTKSKGVTGELFDDDGILVLEEDCPTYFEGIAAALAAAEDAGAQWLITSVSEFTLTKHCIASFVAHITARPEEFPPTIVYADTVEQPRGLFGAFKRRYWSKPQWDPRMFLSQDYVTQGLALTVSPALSSIETIMPSASSGLDALILEMSENGEVEHCARVVAQTPLDVWSRPNFKRVDAIRSHLGSSAKVTPGVFGTLKVQWTLPVKKPTVSLIVATRDRIELLRTCVEGVLYNTDYAALDLTIADNESVEPETLRYMEEVSTDPRVKVVRWPYPFNYSAINNFAVSHAEGEYLCLLNNDIEVIEPEWLTEMMREAVQPGVGAVGARLLYPDLSIQHAGVAIGLGNAAGHAHRGLPEGEPGYFAQALIARGASAVTAACLVVRKDHFYDVGGLDDEHLAVAYNDVDLCLKLQARGLKNIYTPLATMIHHESKSRGLDLSPENLDRYMRELNVFQQRWNTTTAVDHWHHPHLARDKEVYSTA